MPVVVSVRGETLTVSTLIANTRFRGVKRLRGYCRPVILFSYPKVVAKPELAITENQRKEQVARRVGNLPHMSWRKNHQVVQR